MTMLTRLVAAGALVGLTGCGMVGDTFLVDGFLDEGAPQGQDFNTCLAREYYYMTKDEVDVDMEYFHSTRFMRKSWAASSGQDVSPWVPADWNVAREDVSELDAARARLVAAIAANKDARPCECARAQAHFDRWLEQAHDNDLGGPLHSEHSFEGPVQPEFITAERFKAERWTAKCEGAVAAKDFIVYFGYNKFNLTAEALEVISEVAGFAASLANPAVTVTGHTDSSGSNAYNQGLGQRRADAVAGALSSKGVANVSTVSMGESELAVPTGDGVREPLNRRAVISIQ